MTESIGGERIVADVKAMSVVNNAKYVVEVN